MQQERDVFPCCSQRGPVPVSASDEITEIPEQSIVYWSMWEEDEPQADVIREAAEAYEEATGISVEIEWKGRKISDLIGPALDAGEEIDLFDDELPENDPGSQQISYRAG